MSPWVSSFVAVAIVSGLPLLVTLAMAANERAVQRALPYLTLFGAGALLGAACMQLIPEALASGRPLWMVATGVGVGYLAFAAIERLLAGHDHAHAHGMALGAPSAHESDSSAAECVHLHPTPAHGVEMGDVHRARRRRTIAPLAFIGDSVHNLVDGMLIAAGFLLQPGFGLLTAIAIGLHELPREVGTFSLFVHGGIRPMRAVAYNLVTALVSLVGVMVTLVIGARSAALGLNVLPVAAGTYLYIAQAVGVPALREPVRHSIRVGRLGWLAMGFSIVAISAVASAR